MENPSIENILTSRPGIDHFILLDAGSLFGSIARAALAKEGIGHYFKNVKMKRDFDTKHDATKHPVVKITNYPGLQELLIDSARTALAKQDTSNKSWGILWHDGVFTKSDGSWKYSPQHKQVQKIPGIFLRESHMRRYLDEDGKSQHEQKDTDSFLVEDFNILRTYNHVQAIVLMAGDGGFHPSLEETQSQKKIAVLGIGSKNHETAKDLRQDFEFYRIDLSRLFAVADVDPDWIDIMREKAQQRSAVERPPTTIPTQKSEISPRPRRLSRNPYQLLRHRRIRVAYPNITEEKQENQSYEGSPPIFSSEHDVSGQDFTRVIETKNHPIPISEPPQPEPSRASKEPQNEDEWSGFKKALLWGLGAIAAIAYAVNR